VFPDDVIPEIRTPKVVARAAARSESDVLVFPVWNIADRSGESAGVSVPVGGPALLGLAYPYAGRGGLAIRADAFRKIGGFNESGAIGEPCVDLLNRAALAGCRIEVVPAVLARRTQADPLEPLYRNVVWLEAVPWDTAPEEQTELLRPFSTAQRPPELPALYRRSQQLLADIVAGHRDEHARWEEIYGQARAVNERIERAYQDLQAHADRLQHAHDAVAVSESRLRRRIADADRHRQWSDEQRRQLRSQLDVLYSSRSWRITSPLRALRARWRST
jgi:hypothetical protein